MTQAPIGETDVPPVNIVKSRNDAAPIALERVEPFVDSQPEFVLAPGQNCSWAKPSDKLTPDRLRAHIEPWLTALCQSEHLSLLLGAGLPYAIHRLATNEALPGMSPAGFGEHNDVVNSAARQSAERAGRAPGNIEDQIRVATELMRGLEVLGLKDEKAKTSAIRLRETLQKTLAEFAASVRRGERGVVEAAENNRDLAFNYLVTFLMSFASRTGTRERLHIFTTNYDRFIEAGAEVAGIYLLDRFVGSLAPVFRSSRLDLDMHYNPPGIRGEPRYLEGVVRFTKLHGSLDWIDWERAIRRIGMPFGAESVDKYLTAAGATTVDATSLMIYPNSAKDRETAAYPYVELFRDFAAAACRPNHTLFVFGYSFGDEHLNRVIEDMLTIPSTHLVVMSYDDPLRRILKTYERLGRHAQITLLIGDHVGEFRTLVDQYLPKPAIDRTTFRMAELLRARWGARQDENKPPEDSKRGPTGEGTTA